jgi:nuclear receptor subfamily 2 group C
LKFSLEVQTVLLQKSWFDIFALGMSQCAKTLSFSTILTNISLQFHSNFNLGKIDEQKCLLIKEQLFHLQNFITDCERLNINQVEYAYLKLISLFDYGN